MTRVLVTSVSHGDTLEMDGRKYHVVGRIERTSKSVGFNLYPADVEPGRTIASLCWFDKAERVERTARRV